MKNFFTFWRERGSCRYFILILLIVLGIFVRVYDWEDYYYSGDDIFHLFIAKAETPLAVIDRNRIDIHPPLIYLIIHFFDKLGNSILVHRLPSLIFGVLLIPLVFILVKYLTNWFEGLCMAFFVSIGYGPVLMSQVLRQYTIALFFVFCSIYFFIKFKEIGKSKNLFLYFLFSLLSISSHYLMAIPIFSLFIYNLFYFISNKAESKKIPSWLIANLLLGVITFVFYNHNGKGQWGYSGIQISNNRDEWMVFGYPKNLISYLLNFIVILLYFSIPDYIVSNILIFLLLVGLVYSLKEKKYRFIFFIFTVGILISVFINRLGLYPFWGSRHSLHLYPFFILIWSVSIWALRKEFFSRLRNFQKTFIFLLTTCFSVLSVLFVFAKGFYRVFAYEEFPNTVEETKRFISVIDANLGETSLIITDKQTGLLLAFLEKNFSDDVFYPDYVLFRYKSVPVVFKNVWGTKFNKRDLYILLIKSKPFKNNGGSVLIVSHGWTQNGLGLLIQELTEDKCSNLLDILLLSKDRRELTLEGFDNEIVKISEKKLKLFEDKCLN